MNPFKEIIFTTESLCPICFKKIPAQRVAVGDKIYLEKECPTHGQFKTLIWNGKPDIGTWIRNKIPTQPKVCFTPVEKGCPFDCGLCSEHRQHTCTALIEVTMRCNLQCNFCFASSGEARSQDPDLHKIEFLYKSVLKAGGPYNIQLSGGEPTVRDDLPEIIRLGHAMGFHFIQVNTNGLRIGEDEEFVKELKSAGLDSIFLQFDGTHDVIYQKLRGKKLLATKIKAIENCKKYNLGVVLVPTLVPNVNVNNIGEMIDFAVKRLPTVRGIHFQPVSYFGRYPHEPKENERITIPDVIRAIEAQTRGRIKRESFRPPGCENSLCSFHGNYIYKETGDLLPITRHSTACCGKAEKAEEGAEKARQFVARNWSARENQSYNNKETMDWDDILEHIRNYSFSISGMAFQDVWNFDLERVKDCCIHIVSLDGRLIPFCAYNVTDTMGCALYRGR